MKKRLGMYASLLVGAGSFFIPITEGAFAASAFEEKKEEASTLLQKGAYAESFQLFMSLLREEPDDKDVNLGLAQAAQGSKKYPHALFAYERLIDREPRNPLYRLQIARTYLLMEDRTNARNELELARQYDTSLTDQDVEDILASLRHQISRWRYNGQLSAGFMYDSNANQGPNSNVLSLGSFDNLFINGIKKQGSSGAYGSATLEAGYRLEDEGHWWLVGDLGAYQRWNFASDLNANNGFSWGRTAAGIRYAGDETLFDLRLKGEVGKQYHDASRNQVVTSYGPDMIFSWAVVPSTQLITRGNLEQRRYTVSNDRGGQYWSVGEYVRHVFESGEYEVFAGARVLGASVNTSDFGYKGWEGNLRFSIQLPYDLVASPYIIYRKEYYNGPATALETSDRKDEQWRLGHVLTWNISKQWSAELGYQYVYNDSNSSLYDYRQHVVNMGVVWKF